jgi:predicted RNase H-like nuclease (RuvC/YqgF family)
MDHPQDGAASPQPPAPIVIKNQLQTMELELHSLREAQVKQLEAKIKDLESQLLEYSRRYSKLKVRCASMPYVEAT